MGKEYGEKNADFVRRAGRAERHQRMIGVLDRLANGIDPRTGKPLPSDGPYQNIEISRALAYAVRILEHVAADDDLIDDSDDSSGCEAGWLMPSLSRQALNEESRLSKRAYAPWSTQEDEYLRKQFERGVPFRELAGLLQRQASAVRRRLERLGLR